MKKLIAIIFAAVLCFSLGVCAFAAEEPNRYFILKPYGEEPREVAAYAEEKGFDGIILDLNGKADVDYYNDLAKAAPDKSIFVMGDAVLLGKLPKEAGVVIKNGFFEDTAASLCQKHGKDKVMFFLPFEDGDALSWAQMLYGKGLFGGILLENLYSSYSEYSYEDYALDIAAKFPEAKLTTYNDLKRVQCNIIRGDRFDNIFEMNNQYLVNKINGFDFCVRDYRSLLADKNASATALIGIFDSSVLEEYADFEISTKFEITRPTGSSLSVETSKYTVFGTSNPDIPLYVDGVEIERISKSGVFAARLDVPKSGATYVFRQGGVSIPITLKRYSGGGTAGTTKSLSSCKPSAAEVVRSGETEVTLSCVGPSGGSVSAEIAGKRITLKQVAYADPGVPAKFSGKIDLAGNYPENETTLIGKVTYILNYKGERKTKESTEGFYFVGGGARLAVMASVDLTGVEAEPMDAGAYITTLRTGCVDYVTETSENGWYGVTAGGFIKPSQCSIVTGKNDITAHISGSERAIEPDVERLTFTFDNLPAFKGEIIGKALVLTLYNTEYSESLSVIDKGSELMRRIVAVEGEDDSVTLNIYSNVKIWGWDIDTDPETGKFTIAMQPAPKLSDNPSKPLDGVTVSLCAGHGGTDPGALGPTGERGVNEAQINLANTMASAEILENLGATIQIIAAGEEKVGTYGKMDPAREIMADIYICSHANSIAENADANLWCGTQVYYHTDQSASLSDKLTEYISAGTRRDHEGSIQDYYSVTRMTVCPAVMLEVGFMSNPREYESLIDHRDIQKTAIAVANAVLEVIAEA